MEYRKQEENPTFKGASKLENVNFDKLLSSAGKFGLYQIFLFACTFPFYCFGAFSYFGQLFMTEAPQNHWCRIAELEMLTPEERKRLAIPIDESARFGYSQCASYIANWSEVLLTGTQPNHTWSRQPCNHWEFNMSEIPYPTIATDFEWVCDKGSYQAVAQTVYFVGSVVGGVGLGWMADRFGRLPAVVTANVIGCIAGSLSIYANNFLQFAVIRFFAGLPYDNCMMLAYLLVLEYVAPKYRSIAANLPFAVFYTIPTVALPWIALACGHWKTLALATSLPMGLSILALFILPESPRWLMSKGRVDDTVKKVLTIARINKKEIPKTLIDQFKIFASTNTDNDQSGSILEMLKRPILRRMYVLICIEYMAGMIVYDALVRTLHQLDLDLFLSFSFLSLTEFPSLFLLSFILDCAGRKRLSIVTFSMSAIFSVISAFTSGLASVLCVVAARFFINMAVNTSFQWGAELLPTPVRGAGVSVYHSAGYIAIMVSPFIASLSIVNSWLSLTVIGGVSALGALSSAGLPETTKKDMPQTFEDSESLAKQSANTVTNVSK